MTAGEWGYVLQNPDMDVAVLAAMLPIGRRYTSISKRLLCKTGMIHDRTMDSALLMTFHRGLCRRIRVFVVDCFRTYIYQLFLFPLRIRCEILRAIRVESKWSLSAHETIILDFELIFNQSFYVVHLHRFKVVKIARETIQFILDHRCAGPFLPRARSEFHH